MNSREYVCFALIHVLKLSTTQLGQYWDWSYNLVVMAGLSIIEAVMLRGGGGGVWGGCCVQSIK